ncbi:MULTISPECIES: amino acid permease [Brevibacillus]|jgi:arginine/ornithine permease|uniref:Amino acid permease n=1 Tax=Brevibacillus borstelensis AK1 TaxID=1300222 RepID=M8DBY1_9BACL|nr:amino acid permease [Brevibacillus borstelensis]EMT53804.1 amino acid permease [Brevibacillus borstelensis AK1]KKX56793.1 amino acid permease [Brevibacillus borstelensis cifa_chp40]MBE5395971.1 amino acid permease [Brevibacillus borstelensis]MCC0562524.1 amino acid permease [Brevibacillus borstelensis]MCM3469868.1 amino acid permease [Brevibacillus borstelensis]
MASTNDQQHKLKRSMNSRHLFMISLGGVIGTGLFLGSGYTIGQAGPIGTIISYLVGGFIMYLTMLCLGELSVAMPVAGSFQTYMTKFVSPSLGFAVGWLYWFGWAVTVALELLSSGLMMQRWFPESPVWLWCAIFGVVLFLLNALSARAFGESEFWFSSIKVSAIILFIILGGAAMFGLIEMKNGQPAPMFSNYVNSPLLPNGITGLLLTMITVNFSFQGTELIGIAAGESKDPEKTIPKSIRTTVWRTLVFFVLAIFILAGLIPYQQAGVVESPFVAVFDSIGIPYAADIMNFVVLTALLSVANSGLYAATRMLYSLSHSGMASKKLGMTNRKGIPMNALLITFAISLLSLLSGFFAEETVFMVLLSVAGLGAQVGWISLSASQLAFRRQYLRNGGKLEDLKFKTPLYPFLPLLALVLNIAVLVSLAFDPSQRIALYGGVPFVLIAILIYQLYFKNKSGNSSEPNGNAA